MSAIMNKIIPVFTLALGLGVGAWWGRHQAAPEAPVVVGVQPASPIAPAAPTGAASIDMSALRTVIKEELASALGSKEGARTGGSPELPSAESLAKRREAQADIDAMVAGGVWGNEQRVDFQQRLSELGPEERERALHQLVTGLNQGTLKVETDGPPL